ncbi:MAG: Uma2 family endonuclease [Elainellaceae cyanobacterium]
MALTTAKWTLNDYHRMIETGILSDRRVELLNGEIIEMSPEGPDHAYLGDAAGDYLESLLQGRANVREGRPITLPDDSEPEPDIAIVNLLGKVYRQRHPYPEDVFWLIELSNSSLTKDLEPKQLIYAVAGIQEYWVANLKTSELVVFRDPQREDYRVQLALKDGTVQPIAFPDISISVERLFHPE